MLVVSFMACTLAYCEPVAIRLNDQVTRLQCESLLGLMIASTWLGQHEGYTLRGPVICQEGDSI
jgi:hypothetical protein